MISVGPQNADECRRAPYSTQMHAYPDPVEKREWKRRCLPRTADEYCDRTSRRVRNPSSPRAVRIPVHEWPSSVLPKMRGDRVGVPDEGPGYAHATHVPLLQTQEGNNTLPNAASSTRDP